MEIKIRKGKYNFCIKGNPIPQEMIKILNSMFAPEDFVESETFDWNNVFVSEKSVEYNSKSPNQVLRELRISAKLIQKELAEKLGTNVQYVSNLENGIKPIGRKMAIKLGDIFSVDSCNFFRGLAK